MPLHMIKLCVGVETPEELGAWIESRLTAARAAGELAEQAHVTRTMPKRASEILAGGSLYWVIRAKVQVRQQILRFDPVTSADGIARCRIVLDPVLHATHGQPRRAFQGWRYLVPDDAPRDLAADDPDVDALPLPLRRELAELGLL